ncbi:MAG: glycosyltransferase family 2 protein [Acidimicrobiia bacterium]
MTDPDRSEPEVAVVIVSWNARRPLLECLASLAPAALAGELDVVVVDNASTDGTVDAVAASAPWARCIANPSNRGLSAANNQGIAATTAPFVCISNPDVVYRPGTIPALRAAMDDHPRAAFTFARLRHPDGTLQTTVGDLPRLRDALLGRQATRRRRADHGFWWDGWAHDQDRRIGHGLEACYLARRAAIAHIGVQDEGFWLDWEGIDWCARAAELGWESWFVAGAEATHVGGVSLRQAQARWIVESHRSMHRYFSRRMHPAARPVLAVLFGARALVKLASARLRVADYDASHPGSGPA